MKKVICLILSVITLIGILPMGIYAEERPFPDVPANAWYTETIIKAHELGIIQGDEKGNMMPTKPITRAEAVTMIRNQCKRLYDYPNVTEIPFTDVKKSDWFYEAVKWAYCEGFVQGVGNNKFKPNDYVTRQDFAVMIDRYYCFEKSYNGLSTSELSIGQLHYNDFKDTEDVSEYAVKSLKWLTSEMTISTWYLDVISNPIMIGNNGYLKPKNICTRVEVIKMLYGIEYSNGNKTPISLIYLSDTSTLFYDVPYNRSYSYSVYTYDWAPKSWGIQYYSGTNQPQYFHPEKQITKLDICLILFEENNLVPKYTEYTFSDCKINEVEYAIRNGYINGENDGFFYPDKAMTRAEVIDFIYKTKSYIVSDDTFEIKNNSNLFLDWNETGEKYKECLLWATGLYKRISSGTSFDIVPLISSNNGLIRPNDICTRSEIYEMLGLLYRGY